MKEYIARDAATGAVGATTWAGFRIAELPAANVVEVRHGRWWRCNMGGWKCSECNNQAPFWCMASTQNLSDYCPNCGAKMDGGAGNG